MNKDEVRKIVLEVLREMLRGGMDHLRFNDGDKEFHSVHFVDEDFLNNINNALEDIEENGYQ